jgi:hypothetical protein
MGNADRSIEQAVLHEVTKSNEQLDEIAAQLKRIVDLLEVIQLHLAAR